MASRKHLRAAFLRAVHRHTDGDPGCEMSAIDIKPVLQLHYDEYDVLTRQIAELGWIVTLPGDHDSFPHPKLRITMRGVEEAERMERSFYQRFSDEYPLTRDIVRGVAIALVTAAALWIFGFHK